MIDRDTKKGLSESGSYLIENREYIVHRQFSSEKTLTDLIASEISHGILQNKPLNFSADYGMMES